MKLASCHSRVCFPESFSVGAPLQCSACLRPAGTSNSHVVGTGKCSSFRSRAEGFGTCVEPAVQGHLKIHETIDQGEGALWRADCSLHSLSIGIEA